MALPLSPNPPLITATPQGRRARFWSYRWFISLAVLVLVADQFTKHLIIRAMPLGTYGPPNEVTVIPGFFNLVHVGNPGAAWSMFSGQSTVLAVLGVVTLCAIFYWRRSLGLRLLWLQISFGLLCGGIAGNLLDRIRHGYVTDFLDFHFGNYIFPTFNVADSGICVGVIIYLFQSLKNDVSPAKSSTTDDQ